MDVSIHVVERKVINILKGESEAEHDGFIAFQTLENAAIGTTIRPGIEQDRSWRSASAAGSCPSFRQDQNHLEGGSDNANGIFLLTSKVANSISILLPTSDRRYWLLWI